MTLQQLKYAVVTAEKGTVSEAAASLYIAQPSLTKALKELEKEMGISIFNRTNKGVFVSKEGEVFLGYARQVLEQAALITEKYTHQSGGKQEFCEALLAPPMRGKVRRIRKNLTVQRRCAQGTQAVL